MNQTSELARAVRFGVFEVDLRSREIRRRGLRLKLQEKPFQILEALLERPGELVTRKDLRERLWPDTYVGFERSLNTAVNKLRQALDDSPLSPRYVETRARLGYRFIAPVERAAAAWVPPAPAAVDSIAVLPFENATGDPEVEYLTDGLTESIIDNLSRLPAVRVMARSTVFRFKGRHMDAVGVCRELNTRAVVTGRVGQQGGTLVIAVELVDAESGWRLWGEQYSRDSSNVVGLQSEISRDISEKLRVHLSSEERKRLARRATEASEAYHDYLKGRYYLNRLSEGAVQRAIAHFERAVERDAHYALAYAGLADAYSLLAMFSLAPAREVMPKAKTAALKALELDKGLPDAHASLAGILKAYDWDWPGAEAAYRRALTLNPYGAAIHRVYAHYLAAVGRHEEAVTEMARAADLDPLSLIIGMEAGWIRYMARDYQGAVEHALKTLEMEPVFAPAQHTLGLAYVGLGRYAEAITCFTKAREASGGNPAILSALGGAYAAAGRKREASKILGELVALSQKSYISPFLFAVLCAEMGERDAAFEWLTTAVEERDTWLVWLRQSPRLDSLRADPRFADLLRRIAFPGVSR